MPTKLESAVNRMEQTRAVEQEYRGRYEHAKAEWKQARSQFREARRVVKDIESEIAERERERKQRAKGRSVVRQTTKRFIVWRILNSLFRRR